MVPRMQPACTGEEKVKEDEAVPYAGLTPDLILNAVESLGQRCDGRLLALNSYENRVYEMGIDGAESLVVKFYRPGRWSDEQILEEHAYSLELEDHEIPVVPPIIEKNKKTLHEFDGFKFAVFRKEPGRTPELEDVDTLRWLGRFMGRIHAVGRIKEFKHRPALNVETFGTQPFQFLTENQLIPNYLETAYCSVTEEILKRIKIRYELAKINPFGNEGIRLHGDCHPGNLLWTRKGPHFVDFDDCRTGPAIQDLWMLLSGNREEMQTQLNAVLEGYQQFNEFNPLELQLIEALRSLRMIHYSAWLARRRNDPAFEKSFPWFNSPRYWEQQILALREQAAALDEPPLGSKKTQ